MTKGEAKAYLSYSDEQNLEDHYEEFLFKQMEFFRQKPISNKIYNRQFTKIQQAIEAYEILGLFRQKNPVLFNDINFGFELKELFNQYHTTKNQLFQLLYSAESLDYIIIIGNELLHLETKYAACFTEVSFSDSTNSLQDPMNVLKDIHMLNEIGVLFTHQLDTNKHKGFIHLFSEINRAKRVVE